MAFRTELSRSDQRMALHLRPRKTFLELLQTLAFRVTLVLCWLLDAGNKGTVRTLSGAQKASWYEVAGGWAHHALYARVDCGKPVIAVLSIGYRPVGSCFRAAAGWSAATLCVAWQSPGAHWRRAINLLVTAGEVIEYRCA